MILSTWIHWDYSIWSNFSHSLRPFGSLKYGFYQKDRISIYFFVFKHFFHCPMSFISLSAILFFLFKALLLIFGFYIYSKFVHTTIILYIQIVLYFAGFCAVKTTQVSDGVLDSVE